MNRAEGGMSEVGNMIIRLRELGVQAASDTVGNNERGYLDKYFTGWLDLRNFKMLDYAALARLLIAYIDDARAVDDKEALKILNLHAN